jgi:hypothetical protein
VDSHQNNPSDNKPSLAEEVAQLAPAAKDGHFDELHETASTLAGHWKTFFEQLEPTGLADFDQKTQELNRQIRENGITYNVYADEYGPQRPWSVDFRSSLMQPLGKKLSAAFYRERACSKPS